MQKLLLSLLLIGAGMAHAAVPMPRVSGEAAVTTGQPQSALTLRTQTLRESEIARVRYGDLDPGRIAEVKQRNTLSSHKAMQIGIARETNLEAPGQRQPALTWVTLANGDKTARLIVSSNGAQALRVGLQVRAIPAGAELRFVGSADPAKVIAMTTAEEILRLKRESAVYWTPMTLGEQQVIEFYLPAGRATSSLRVDVDTTSHIFASPQTGFKDAKILGAAGACNRDVACETPTPALINAKNAVARMTFQSNNGTGSAVQSYTCTGTLLNDNDPSTQVPYFYTANHCIGNQTEASTLNTIWFYENSSCGSNDARETAVIAGGAQLLFQDTRRDVVLLRLNTAPPTGAFFSGWDPNTVTAATPLVSIHHPEGDAKKVTLGQATGFTPLSDFNGQEFITAAWTSGTTEGGSSGAGIFTLANNEYFLRGGLYGGTASCSNAGTLDNTQNRDYFSRFDQVYSSLKTYLEVDYTGVWGAPGENGLGMSVLRGNSGALGVIWYQYDPDQQPTWFLLAGNWTSSTTFAGNWLFFNATGYDVAFASTSVISVVKGNATLTFTSPTTATLNYTLDGFAGTKNLVKQSF